MGADPPAKPAGSDRISNTSLSRDAAAQRYPKTERMKQVAGVGVITSLCYVLTLEDPTRCDNSRVVGAYLGMRPRRRDSGGSSPQLRNTKSGDALLRRLLVGSAQYILGPFGPDCDLRRWGLNLAQRGAKADGFMRVGQAAGPEGVVT